MAVIVSHTVIRPDMDLDELYHKLEMNYPKFFKMDELCRTALLGAEIVLRQSGCADDKPKHDMSVILFNRSSSFDSDHQYSATIALDSYFPSPALFSYSLANIMTGQICIKFRILGESSLYISERFDAEDFIKKVLWGLNGNCLCGWVDCFRGNHELVMMHVRSEGEGVPFDRETVYSIFKQL